ncbi:MAG: pilus assembly protein [Silicimonas sp.]|nr:pilus assembly protein [Silicimonas sp.]
MKTATSRFVRFGRREDGNATIEFVMLFPLFIMLFLMGFESGYFMVRNVMLERAVDISSRDIRLGNGKVPQFDALKEQICENVVIMRDCVQSIHIYMTELDIEPGAVASVTGPARCLNRYSDEDQFGSEDYSVGQSNTMMLMQVCASATPFFPTTGIGLGMQKDELGGDFAIVATAAFVNEPGTRAMAPYSPPMGGGT